MSISVCIIAKNAEKHLFACLTSVTSFADEIVLVDDDSTDNTVAIAKKFNARIYKRTLDTFCNQKNYAVGQAKGNWIFAIDADEECSEDLVKDILHAVNDSSLDGYRLPRKNILLGAEIRHTRWSPDEHIWLFKKAKGRWVGDIHEEVVVDGIVGHLDGAKIHHSYETVTAFITMMNNYTTRIADEMFKNRVRYSFTNLVWATKRSFWGRYIVKKGFADGWRGFILSYMMGIYRMSTWIKLWERYNNRSNI